MSKSLQGGQGGFKFQQLQNTLRTDMTVAAHVKGNN